MLECAWLEFHEGRWHQLTGRERNPIRTWTDKDTFPAEKWRLDVSGPHRQKIYGQRSMGYALMRVVHWKENSSDKQLYVLVATIQFEILYELCVSALPHMDPI